MIDPCFLGVFFFRVEKGEENQKCTRTCQACFLSLYFFNESRKGEAKFSSPPGAVAGWGQDRNCHLARESLQPRKTSAQPV